MMKNRTEIEAILRQHKPELAEKFHVQEIGIFGSYGRGEETEGSDVDLLVEFSGPVGLKFFDLKEYLEDILCMKVDLATEGGLRKEYREEVLSEVVYS